MSLSSALNRVVLPRGDANSLRWSEGKRGHYEAYYLTVNHRPTRTGVWLRYTLDAPLTEGGVAELWAHVFEEGRVVGLKRRLPIAGLRREHGLAVGIGDASLGDGHAKGEIEDAGHRIAWDLRFPVSPTRVHLVPAPLRALGVASTNLVWPDIDVPFTGTLMIDGRELRFESEPGQQAHLWGSKHAEKWAWGHCNAFDGRTDCVVDGVAAWLKRFGSTRGPLTGIYVRYRGEDYLLNGVPQLLRTKGTLAFPAWSFEGSDRGLSFRGTFTGRPEQMAQVEYEDPDGEKSYCCNTCVGDLTIEVRRGAEKVDELKASGTAHLEFGDRKVRDGVRRTV